MDSKLQSILSYLGILWVLAFILGKEQRNDLSRFHLKQGLGLLIVSFILSFASFIVLMILPSLGFIFYIASIIIFVLVIMGVINAANEKKQALPIIGNYFTNAFPFIDSE